MAAALLRQEGERDLLRFTTAGSVDDGKSTLIGRLLHDANALYDDQIEALRKRAGREATGLDFSLITDGLKAEREQGITIDVAYRYFATAKRRFIIADTPGHEQYTRNMATGASTADVAVVLIDARLGVLTQSKRHGFIASLLGVPHLVVAVNKMDLVGYDEAVFERIREEYLGFTARLGFAEATLHSDERAQWRQRRLCQRRICRGIPAFHCSPISKTCISQGTTTSSISASRCNEWCDPTRTSAVTAGRWLRAWCARVTRSSC